MSASTVIPAASAPFVGVFGEVRRPVEATLGPVERADLVVGAGPGGETAALHLARRDRDVRVIG